MSDLPTQEDSIWGPGAVAARRETFSTVAISEDTSGASGQQNSDQDIIRLIPDNDAAQLAFDSVVQLQRNKELLPNHAQFLKVTGAGLLDEEVDPATGEESMGGDQERKVFKGYFRVRFGLPEPLVSTPVRWVCKALIQLLLEVVRYFFRSVLMLQQIMGRGKVDILLAAPKSPSAFGLHSVHAFLDLHQQSGAWMLTAVAKLTAEETSVSRLSSFCLHRPKTTIQIAKMRYLVKFAIDSIPMELQYIEARNAMLKKGQIPVPETQISGIPMDGDSIRECIIYRHRHAWGTFGNVFEGYDPESGDLRVAKRITIRKIKEAETVRDEIRALERFGGREGILRLIDWSAGPKSKNLSDSSRYPLDVDLIHEKGLAFHKVDWSLPSMTRDVKIILCFQLLKGVEAIHADGCMHRDITPMNLLLFPSANPPKAALSDFGKFCDRASAIDTHLADWRYLPPEMLPPALQPNKKAEKPYNQAIDMYMLGLALTISWWPEFKNIRPRDDLDGYEGMVRILLDEKPALGLANAIARMLDWDPQTRHTATRSLDHDCFRTIRQQRATIKTADAKRLHKD